MEQKPQVVVTGLTTALSIESHLLSPTCVADSPDHAILSGRKPDSCAIGPGVALTGGILARLGISAHAVVEWGEDPCGQSIRQAIESASPSLRTFHRLAPKETTRRLFVSSWQHEDLVPAPEALTHPFPFDDLPLPEPASRSMAIWCYPPALSWRQTGEEDGFCRIFESVASRGVTQCLVLGRPFHKRQDSRPWQDWLRPLLDHTNILCAQADHLLETLDPESADQLAKSGLIRDLSRWLSGRTLHDLSNYLLACGVGCVVIGLRDHGIYLRTNSDSDRVAFIRKFAPNDQVAAHLAAWTERDMLIPPFMVDVCNRYSTTDALCAGFAASLLRGLVPGEAIRMAAAVVGMAMEAKQPLDSIAPWEVAAARVNGGWEQGHCAIDLSGWSEDEG